MGGYRHHTALSGGALAAFLFTAPLYGHPITIPCIDARAPPHIFSGKLTTVVAPGPPNYESIERGDRRIEAYILELSLPAPLCVENDADGYITPDVPVSRVHVYSINPDILLRRYLDSNVTIVSNHIFGSHTGYHQAPLVAEVHQIQWEGSQ